MTERLSQSKAKPADSEIDFRIDEVDSARLGVHAGRVPSERWIDCRTDEVSDPFSLPLVFAGPFEVYDFTEGYDPDRKTDFLFGIGRYDEDRRGMYTSELFRSSNDGRGVRTVHMGVDLQAPAGTPVFSPIKGVVHAKNILAAPGDYGGVIIVQSEYRGRELYHLFGHLSHLSIQTIQVGEVLDSGQRLGWLGEKNENGGWNSHLHYQLSWLKPLKVDLPGAVETADRVLARRIFPDPRLILKGMGYFDEREGRKI